MAEDHHLTVAELMVLLAHYPPDARVWHEGGCEHYGCYGKAVGIEYDASLHMVIIMRPDV